MPNILYVVTDDIKSDDGTTDRNERVVQSVGMSKNTVDFLDIKIDADEQRKLSALQEKTVKSYTRSGRLASTGDSGTGSRPTNITVKQSKRSSGSVRSGKGGKRVTLKTGKLVTGGDTTNKKRRYHTVSFNFPADATVKEISDLLASIIPDNKISWNAGATEVEPFFKLEGGRRYAIISKAESEGLSASEGGTDPIQSQTAGA